MSLPKCLFDNVKSMIVKVEGRVEGNGFLKEFE